MWNSRILRKAGEMVHRAHQFRSMPIANITLLRKGKERNLDLRAMGEGIDRIGARAGNYS